MASVSVQDLKNHFFRLHLNENSDNEAARSQFFSLCCSYYESIHPQIATGLEDDKFFKAAQKVLKKTELFDEESRAYVRLKRPAASCIENWNELLKAFSVTEIDLAASKVDQFVISHVTFKNRLLGEYIKSDNTTVVGVRLNSPLTVDYFYQAVLDFLRQHPDLKTKNRIQEMFDTSDPEICDFIYYQTILKAVIEKEFQEGIPEYFVPHLTQIKGLKEQYLQLPFKDQALLKEAHFQKMNNSWDESSLSTQGFQFHQEIFEFIYSVRESKQRRQYAVLEQAVSKLINQDLVLIDTLESWKEVHDLKSSPGLQDILEFLLLLSDEKYEVLKEANLVPTKKKLNQVTLENIKDYIQIERILPVLELAKDLHQKKNAEASSAPAFCSIL